MSMNSRLDKNNNGKSHKKVIVISIVAILFVVMLMITVASLSIAGKSSIEAESAKSSKQIKKVSSSSSTSVEKSTNVSSDVSSSTETVNSNEVTDDEQSMYFTRVEIGVAVGKAMYYDAGDDVPQLDHFEEIPGGFKIYYVDGMTYNVRDTGYRHYLASMYDFGGSHGYEIYFDNKPAVGLEVPQMGGANFDITPDMLKQYAIR